MPEIVFPRTGVFVWHARAGEVVADANHILFFNANEAYRVSHPRVGGDDCTSFVFSASVVADALDVHHQVIRADAERPYRRSHGLLGLKTIVRQQLCPTKNDPIAFQSPLNSDDVVELRTYEDNAPLFQSSIEESNRRANPALLLAICRVGNK